MREVVAVAPMGVAVVVRDKEPDEEEEEDESEKEDGSAYLRVIVRRKLSGRWGRLRMRPPSTAPSNSL